VVNNAGRGSERGPIAGMSVEGFNHGGHNWSSTTDC
jgi:hypothetical protein